VEQKARGSAKDKIQEEDFRLKEFGGGKENSYKYTSHTTHTLHAAEKSFGIEIEDSSLGARIFLCFRLFRS
jgi:hypothetical protein